MQDYSTLLYFSCYLDTVMFKFFMILLRNWLTFALYYETSLTLVCLPTNVLPFTVARHSVRTNETFVAFNENILFVYYEIVNKYSIAFWPANCPHISQ